MASQILRSQLIASIGILAGCGSGGSAVVCDDGTVCIAPNTCNEEGACEAPHVPSECEGLEDGDACNQGRGSCQSDVCVDFACGNNILETGEVCDGPTADGEDCVGLGFEYGTPSCAECAGEGQDRCGVIGWRPLSDGEAHHGVAASYAVGRELWMGDLLSGGSSFDGTGWRDIGFGFTSIHGSSRSNIWSFNFGSVRRFDGQSWSEPEAIPFSDTSGALLTLGAEEVLLAGRSTEGNGIPAIWQYDGTTWSIVHTGGAGAGYQAIVLAGDTVVAARNGQLSIRQAGVWRNVDAPGMSDVRNMWARAANDVYIATSARIYQFNGSTLLEASPLRNAMVGGIGDSTYFVGVGGMTEHRVGTPFSQVRILKAEGTLGDGQGDPGEPVRHLVSTGERMFVGIGAGGTTASVYEFDGTAFAATPDLVGTTRDMSAVGDTLYWLGDIGGQRSIATVSGAFGPTPTLSTAPAPAATRLWARAQDDVLALAGDIYRWDGATLALEFDASAVLNDIDGDGDRVVAVGRAAALAFENNAWSDISSAVFAAVELRGVYVASGGIVAVGDGGRIFVRRQASWEEVESSTNGDMFEVAGLSIDNFYIASTEGIIHCQGQPLVCAAEGPLVRLFALAVASPRDILALSNNDQAIHFDGLAWSPVSLRGSAHLAVARGESVWLATRDAAGGPLERLDRIRSWEALGN